MTTSAPTNGSILSKIYYEKTKLRPDMVKILKRDRCLLNTQTADSRTATILNSEFYLVGATKASDMLLGMPFLVTALPKKLWFIRRNIYNYNLVLYYRREKERIGQE